MSMQATLTPPREPVAGNRPSLLLNAGLGRVLILGLGLVLLSDKLTSPFMGHREWNSAEFCIFARNHIAYGLGYTKLYCTWGNSRTPPVEPWRYLNHPPLIAAWVALPMLLFGDHEWAARLVPIAATLGSAWLLMILVGRLHSPGLGVLTGLFYVTLPATAYFGRMVDHHPLAQFFSLLMLHGYLLWIGLYDGRPRRAGLTCYALGALLGIGTAWVVAILAGLIWLWNLLRARHDRVARRLVPWLAAIPALGLLAVVLHILGGCAWNWQMLAALLSSRTVGANAGAGAFTGQEWLQQNWTYVLSNFTLCAAVAAALYLLLAPSILWLAGPSSPWRRIVPSATALTPVLLLLLQGLLWVVAFPNQSWMHDYWQYLLGPFVALSLASVVLAAATLLARLTPSLAGLAALLGVSFMPAFARGREYLYRSVAGPADTIEAFIRLAELVPARAPALVSVAYPEPSERFAEHTNRWRQPQIEYYARRPLILATRLDEIVQNPSGCAAYVLALDGDPRVRALRDGLAARYEAVPVRNHHVIFLLDHPRQPP